MKAPTKVKVIITNETRSIQIASLRAPTKELFERMPEANRLEKYQTEEVTLQNKTLPCQTAEINLTGDWKKVTKIR